MVKSRRSQKNQHAINATVNPDRKKWRKKDNVPSTYPNNIGSFYFPGGVNGDMNPMYLPFLPQEGGGGGGGGGSASTTTNGNTVGYQPYYHPGGGDPWAVDRYYGMTGANVNPNAMAAQADDLEDQEKRLFLEEFRYPGQHTQYEPPCCDNKLAEPVPDMGKMVEAVNTDMAATEGDKGMASKLRGDAPEFVPTKKSSSSESDGKSSTWTIVTSW